MTDTSPSPQPPATRAYDAAYPAIKSLEVLVILLTNASKELDEEDVANLGLLLDLLLDQLRPAFETLYTEATTGP